MGDCLRMLRSVLYAENGDGNQAFLIAGSGTMGWDSVGVNLLERGDDAVRLLLPPYALLPSIYGRKSIEGALTWLQLVLNTGYFGDSFVEW